MSGIAESNGIPFKIPCKEFMEYLEKAHEDVYNGIYPETDDEEEDEEEGEPILEGLSSIENKLDRILEILGKAGLGESK